MVRTRRHARSCAHTNNILCALVGANGLGLGLADVALLHLGVVVALAVLLAVLDVRPALLGVRDARAKEGWALRALVLADHRRGRVADLRVLQAVLLGILAVFRAALDVEVTFLRV